jgi:hypothetical protein
MRRASHGAVLLLALLVFACAEPPNKEMGQAQGAIDTARAAGADKYAPDEYASATKALQQANDAVAQRDYRAALNLAIESREHAQNAAREAAETRARVRGQVERSMAEVATLLAEANERVTTAPRSRIPRRVVRQAQQTLAGVNDDVQKAGAAMKAEDYSGASAALTGVKERIQQVIASLTPPAPTQTSRRPR